MPTRLVPNPCVAWMVGLLRRTEPDAGDHGEAEVEGVAALRSPVDDTIVAALERLSRTEDEYWSFRGRATRQQTQGLTQYPAMMVPAMQAVLVKAVACADKRVTSVFDPFAGSGTTLVECMRLGLDYTGQDINPLAVLFCRTKAGPFHTRKLACSARDVVDQAAEDRGTRIEADFPGLNKWFCPVAVKELSQIRRAVRRVDHQWCRQVLWTGLAETVRLTSNSRTSTFKLHVRSAEDLESRNVSPLQTFEAIMGDIVDRVREEAGTLRKEGHLSTNGYYRGDVTIRLCDSTESNSEGSEHDLLVTSPPYGDNTSTVPYGQYSYLPLQWIDLEDIDEDADSDCLRTAYEIDKRSLGGRRRNAVRQVEELMEISPSLRKTLCRLEELPPDRRSRVAAFARDLDASLDAATAALRAKGYMIWTIGNRCIGGEPVPTDDILEELLSARDVHRVTRVDRKIPSKRMATRNAIASTMRGEAILVFRKA